MSVNSPRGELSRGRGICKPAPRAGSEVCVWKSSVYRRHLRPWDSVKSVWGECTVHAPVPELTRAHDKTQTCITVHGAPQVLPPAAPPRLPPLALGAGPPHCPWNDLVRLRVSGSQAPACSRAPISQRCLNAAAPRRLPTLRPQHPTAPAPGSLPGPLTCCILPPCAGCRFQFPSPHYQVAPKT